MRLPTRKSELERLQNQKDDPYLTPAAIKRMQDELEDLEKRQRAPAAEEVARCAQMGDLSENAAYQYAKQNLRRINARIITLQERLKHAIPISDAPSDGTVHIGSKVKVRFRERELTFEILGSHESYPARGRISHVSPLGAALAGKRAGDRVSVKTDAGEMEYEILSIE